MSAVRRSIRMGVPVLVLATSALSLVACGSSSSGGGASAATECNGIGDDIKVAVIKDQTGIGAFVGTPSLEGVRLAVKTIEEQKFLGDTTITLDVKDPASDSQTGASQVTASAADRDTKAILGPILSDMATATAPIAERAKIPIIFTQAGSEGVLAGEYTFRASPPIESYYDKTVSYLDEQNVKKISTIYSADNPTLTELATATVPELASQHGIEIGGTGTVQASTQDMSAPVSKLLESNPDAVALLVTGPQFSSAIQQLRQSGFTGKIVSYPAAGNVLPTIGQDAAGIVWSTNFDHTLDTPEAQEFSDAFMTEYGKEPTNSAAESYDSTWFLARAIKAADCDTREGIQQGLTTVAAEGFEGVEGPISFEGNDARFPGILVEWTGSEIQIIGN